MFDLIALPSKSKHRVFQLLITLVMILLLGKLVSLLPVMQKLVLFRTIRAANAVWFVAEISSLCVFYFFARYAIASLPNKGGFTHFLRGIASPLALLIMVILLQDLVWQLLAPFVSNTGKTVYFGISILLISAVAVWLVLMAYQHSDQLASSVGRFGDTLSKAVQPRKMICGNCHAEVSSKARFCDKCGHKMPESHYCPECGVTVSDDQNFCRDCGANLKVSTKDSTTNDSMS